MKRMIYFDMDGTLAGLFFVKGFSAMLSAGDMTPYIVARPLYNVAEMNSVIKALKNKGYEIGIISYADAENLEAATIAKTEWLRINFPYASIENIHITTKATSKASYYRNGDILVDDARANREEWENVGGETINAYFRAKVKMIDALRALI